MSRAHDDNALRQRTPAVVDGVNPYERPAVSEQFARMVEAGRERVVARLQQPVGGDRTTHDVALVEELSEGRRLLDKFRVTCGSPDGFSAAQRAALDALAYRVVPGAGDAVLFALIDHAAYDRRVLCCDLSPVQVALLATLYLVGSALLWHAAVESGGAGPLVNDDALDPLERPWYAALLDW